MGSTKRIRNALGTAPINGPKNGITLVTPTITLIRSTYGIFKNFKEKKHMMPMISLKAFL